MKLTDIELCSDKGSVYVRAEKNKNRELPCGYLLCLFYSSSGVKAEVNCDCARKAGIEEPLIAEFIASSGRDNPYQKVCELSKNQELDSDEDSLLSHATTTQLDNSCDSETRSAYVRAISQAILFRKYISSLPVS